LDGRHIGLILVGGVVMNEGYRKRLRTVLSMIRVRTEVIKMSRKSEWVLGETIFGTGRMDACF